MPESTILITNDDGIHSKGILALQQSMKNLGRTVVVAPETEKSAVGHAITISDPIRIREITRGDSFAGYAVGGTPADCVKLGVKALLDNCPDLIVSGVNRGANVGMSIIYSGTVSAATEGVILGVPSIAVSLDTWVDTDYSYAAEVAYEFGSIVLRNGLSSGTALNINVPDLEKKAIKGIRLTKQGDSYYEEAFDRRIDPRQRIYYWMDGRLVESEENLDLDDIALREGYVSVTPLHYNLTDHRCLTELDKWSVFKNDIR
ncbi:MAG: 5'/3'-nucleotidase SurE [Candidatus Marinimicrobia bacterium]|nr:5'/3'-nucleotidase SurE [Candidatus Neomarinimicrobiota bacterium]MDP6593766.1 5'/3'-nucleotidase SurE [Candidatus Neomarinimicrobiota bacterium]MDP6967151.1 5'/3'-nucleotidase SurE [Candidatus Neomarinimicrobiota bacterium]|tara:strand:+ start:1179 stop:1958 length:780 start_codon:yes stop_codon:yes gene_type:complete